MADYSIRPATPADFDAILALWFSIDRHTGLPDKPEYLQQLLDFSPDLFLVAEADGLIAGTIIGGWDGCRGHIAQLATDRALRRTGIAQALVSEIESRLKSKSAHRIYALVDRRSKLASPFWKAAGYRPDDDIVQYSRNASK
ncbi:MAG: GNAT family N-acetyltransferase [Chloroflexota bacterium]|nr:GNAT family N-acetyltransferase [Chloroflexota bacterium]